jgi:hypothetical protein
MEDFDENAFAVQFHMELGAHMSAKSMESIKIYQPGVEAA